MSRSSALAAWQPRLDEFPFAGTTSELLRSVLQYAVLAPSGHNTQPWRFRIVDEAVDLLADRSRALPVVDPEDRELVIGCGAALFHLRLALRCFGSEARVERFPDPSDPDWLARVRIGGVCAASIAERRMFEAILERRTNRGPFEDRPLPNGLDRSLERDASDEGVELLLRTRASTKAVLAKLVAEGDGIQMADRAFRRELGRWVRPNRSRRRDGMRGYAFGVGDLPSLAGAVVLRTFDMGKRQAARDKVLATRSPALVVFHTTADRPADWLATGQALARVLLRATSVGVSASFLNQPVELPALRRRLAHATCDPERFPQLLLRLGVGRDRPKPMPRRLVEEVLMTAAGVGGRSASSRGHRDVEWRH